MLRALATRYLERTTNDGITALRDTVGENVGSGPPDWRWNVRASYSRDAINMALTARGISSGVYDNRFIECTQFCPVSLRGAETTSNNHIDGQVIFDASFNYKLATGGADTTLFLDVSNVLNSDPPVVGRTPGADGYFYSPANFSMYDYLGRVYRAGIRVTF